MDKKDLIFLVPVSEETSVTQEEFISGHCVGFEIFEVLTLGYQMVKTYTNRMN